MSNGRNEPAARNRKVRIGAVGDLHFSRSQVVDAWPVRELLAQASRECDVLVLTGDLTDRGLPD